MEAKGRFLLSTPNRVEVPSRGRGRGGGRGGGRATPSRMLQMSVVAV